jgi:hypothetical protein
MLSFAKNENHVSWYIACLYCRIASSSSSRLILPRSFFNKTSRTEAAIRRSGNFWSSDQEISFQVCPSYITLLRYSIATIYSCSRGSSIAVG